MVPRLLIRSRTRAATTAPTRIPTLGPKGERAAGAHAAPIARRLAILVIVAILPVLAFSAYHDSELFAGTARHLHAAIPGNTRAWSLRSTPRSRDRRPSSERSAPQRKARTMTGAGSSRRASARSAGHRYMHPGSGRKTLYLASHASHIIGWPVALGRALLDELIAFATQPRFVYQHRWRAGDLVVWDNRCTLHRGRPYDDVKFRRDMRRTTIEESAPTSEQQRTRDIRLA